MSDAKSVTELFDQWLAETKVVNEAATKALKSRLALKKMIKPLIKTAIDKVNELHPGNIHIGSADFQIIDRGSVWITLLRLYRADTMKEVASEAFGQWCDMTWLQSIENIFKQTLGLDDKIKVNCTVNSYYWEDSK